MLDYASIILWVLEHADMVANAFVVGSITANVRMGVGVVGALGTIVFGLIGHVAIVGLATIVIVATIASDFFL